MKKFYIILIALTSIEGDLFIIGNASLTSLAGLDKIDAGSISDLYIREYTLLSTCAVQSICDYLAAPNDEVEIHDHHHLNAHHAAEEHIFDHL